MVVEAVVKGVGGETSVLLAAEAEILLFGRISFVDGSVASAAFLLRVLGEMMTGTRRQRPSPRDGKGLGGTSTGKVESRYESKDPCCVQKKTEGYVAVAEGWQR